MSSSKSKNLPFQNVSVVIGQVASANELWDLNGFCHSWEEKKTVVTSFCHTVAASANISGWWAKLGDAGKKIKDPYGAQVNVAFGKGRG